MKGKTFGLNSIPLFEDGPGPVLEPVGGEFQPTFETVYPGGGAHLISYKSRMKAIRGTETN
jgi:hypothetical protein